MSSIQEDFEWLREHDEDFSFKTVEEWMEFLEETKEDREEAEREYGRAE